MTGAPPALERLATFAARVDVATLPDDVVDKAKTCIIDALFGAFLINRDARAMSTLAAITLDTAGPASIPGSPHRASPAEAAFCFAASTAASDRSDTHPPSATHPGLAVVPAALALGEAAGADGRALIAGVVAGYEVWCRLAAALVTRETAAIWRPTALVAPTAAALAGARAIGLPRDAMIAAGSLAAQTSCGFNEWAHAGTGEHPFHAAFAARNAVTAVLLAKNGASAAPSVLDGPSGLLAGFNARDRAALLTADLGEIWEIRSIIHKPAPACFFVQTPCQVARDVVRNAGRTFNPQDVASVEIRVTETAARYPGCDNAAPMQTLQAAIMSLQFSVASVLASGDIRERNWQEFTDATVAALAARSRVIVDDRLTAAYPALQGAGVRVELTDGHVCENAANDFRSMSRDEVVERFLEAAAPHLGRDQAQATIMCVDRLEQVSDIRSLTGRLRTSR